MNDSRPALDRLLAAIPYALVAIGVLALLFWQASIRKTPTIFGDELEWTQISRAIADTGHAARRGQPVAFKSVYPYVIAPLWRIHSTSSAYSAIKYADTILMALTAVPTFLLARMLVSTRIAFAAALATLCTTGVYYAPFLLPEVVAWPWFALCAYLTIRALARSSRWWIAAAAAADVVAPLVRGELVVVPAAAAAAVAIVWLCGPVGSRALHRIGIVGQVVAVLARRHGVLRPQPGIRRALAGMGDRHAPVERPPLDARDGVDVGARSRARPPAVRRRPRVAVASGAPERSRLACVRRLRRLRAPDDVGLYRREGCVPLDRVRNPGRGTEPDLRPAAARRRHRRLAVRTPPLARRVARGLGVRDVAGAPLRLPAGLPVLRVARLRHRGDGQPRVPLGPADDPPCTYVLLAAAARSRHPDADPARRTHHPPRARGGRGRVARDDGRRRGDELARVGDHVEDVCAEPSAAARLGRPGGRRSRRHVRRRTDLHRRRTRPEPDGVLEPQREEHLVARRIGARPGPDPDTGPAQPTRRALVRRRPAVRPDDGSRRARRQDRRRTRGVHAAGADASLVAARGGVRDHLGRLDPGDERRPCGRRHVRVLRPRETRRGSSVRASAGAASARRASSRCTSSSAPARSS